MKKIFGILALSAVAFTTFANVDLRTNIQDLYYRGSCEEAGSITMSVNGNDFADATTQDPTYIRVRLTHDAVLCGNLVGNWATYDGQGTQVAGFYGEPIYLAVRLEDAGATGNNTIAAHPETVSIVRWIAGEQYIWLRVQSASDTWIFSTSQQAVVAPSLSNGRVAWTFGVTAAKSVQANASVSSNLPANTRDSSYTVPAGCDPNYPAISTLICVNLEESVLDYYPNPESTLKFDTISYKDTAWNGDFGVFTAMPGVTIDKGNQIPTNYSGDDSIARGVQGDCTGSIYKPSRKFARLCLDAGGQGVDDNGLVLMENRLNIRVNCSEGWHNNSYIYFYNANEGPWGFPLQVDTANDETINQLLAFYLPNGAPVYRPRSIPSASYYVNTGVTTDQWFLGTPKNMGGYYFTDDLVLWYQGPGSMSQANTIIVNMEVGQYYADEPGPVQVGLAVWAADKDSRWENGFPAFGTCSGAVVDTLADQANYWFANDYCPPSYSLALNDVWDFGAFLPCEYTVRTSIFFPYLPKLQGTDFWTGIALVNHGGKDFPADGGLVGSAYEADGNHWEVEFPALPRQTMQTWLVTEDEAGVGFYGVQGDPTEGLFLQPQTSGNDLVFGEVRWNLFVTGSYLTTGSRDGDLDGYCLIGRDTSINGSYLARNIGPDSGGNDMPTVTGKADPKSEQAIFDMSKMLVAKRKSLN
ncbi:MAG: hypothetical protein CR997_07950 [Acidobacteria bacterium]|nr:MAG: hypothetical protein CR997_07950 [Acidobacteriota bacterium]